jgi:hypothetical protein
MTPTKAFLVRVFGEHCKLTIKVSGAFLNLEWRIPGSGQTR